MPSNYIKKCILGVIFIYQDILTFDKLGEEKKLMDVKIFADQ